MIFYCNQCKEDRIFDVSYLYGEITDNKIVKIDYSITCTHCGLEIYSSSLTEKIEW